MVGALFPWVAVGFMFAASVFALVQVPSDVRLPMQWGIRGQVTWRAPPAVALFFAPLLAVVIVGLMTLTGAQSSAGLGGAPVLVALVLLVVHGLYVFLVLRDLEERGGGPRRSGRQQ
jgi:hypothetical protein